MNRIHRLIWSLLRKAWVVTHERANAYGKGSQTRRSTHAGAILLSTLIATAASANPVGPQVIHGTASIVQSGNKLTITNSPNAIINWQSFSIGATEKTHFFQPSSSSAVLNRVLGNDPSQLLGQLQSNGKVFLVNPSGILVGPGASINVGGLVASTLNLSNEDFLAGKLRFTSTSANGGINNRGEISTGIGGTVVLTSDSISNEGIIRTPQGQTVLAAGQTVQIEELGAPGLKVTISGANGQATNLGQIVADAGQIGVVAALVKNSGTLNTSSVERQGGRVFLRATKKLDLTETSKVGADGTAGGDITAIVSENGQINGELVARGKITAEGNGAKGSGGFVETSAAKLNLNGLRVRTHGGRWLIDPQDFTIAAADGDMTGADVNDALVSSDLEIQSSQGSDNSGNGDIHVNDAISWNSHTLTLTAGRNVNINAVMTASGTSALILNPATANGSDEYQDSSGTVRVGFNPDGSFKGRVDFPSRSGSGFLTINGNAYTVINSLGTESSTTEQDLQGMQGNPSRHYALGSNIDAAATASWTASGNGFFPVGDNLGEGEFSGSFDGLGHTITGLTINRPSSSNVGLFGVSSGSVRNVGLVAGSVQGAGRVGMLIGANRGNVLNAYAAGSVSGGNDESRIGGLVGDNSGLIDNSYAVVNVSGGGGSGRIGGLVGSSMGEIARSHASGSVSGGNSSFSIGGLVGEINDGDGPGIVRESYAIGTVSGGDGTVDIGGLIGNVFGHVSESFATGSVNAGNSERVGGLAGYNGGYIQTSYASGNVSGVSSVGGLVGENRRDINYSYATGSVSGGNAVGGLVGLNKGLIEKAYASGSVTGSADSYAIGGLVGEHASDTIRDTYSFGGVSAGNNSSAVGGLAGTSSGSVTSSFWNIESSGQTTSAAGAGITHTQMTSRTSFSGWDFANTWAIDTNTSYPYLQGNEQIAHPFVTFNVWTGVVDNQWNSTGNWSLGHVPDATERVSIPDVVGRDYIELSSGTVTSQSIFSQENFRLSNNGTALTLTGRSNFNAGLQLGTGTLVTANGPLTLSASPAIGTGARIDLGVNAEVTIAGTHFTIIRSLGNDGDSNSGTNLQGIATYSLDANNFVLANNIDASETSTWNAGEGFLPVQAYSGKFDGFGHAISGLTINRPTEARVGLFGWITGGEVRNIAIDGANIAGRFHVGALAGVNSGTIEHSRVTSCTVNNNDPTSGAIGGLVGENQGVISQSSASVAVTANHAGGIGGLAGTNSTTGTITNSSSAGTVSGGVGSSSIGGLVGDNSGSIISSYATGAVSGGDNSYRIGGLVGRSTGQISRSHAIGNVSGGDNSFRIGGLVGENIREYEGGPGIVLESYASGTVTGGTSAIEIGGLVGLSDGEIRDSYATGNVSGGAGSGRIGGLVGGSAGEIGLSHASGSVSGGDNSFSIGGLVGEVSDTESGTGVVSDSYASANVSGGEGVVDVGGLIGRQLGSVSDSFATGSVNTGPSSQRIGGLAGFNSGDIRGSYASGNVSGVSFVGGLVGENQGSITTSYASGSVTGSDDSSAIGGLVGSNSGTISDNYASGDVSGGTGSNGLGGLAGSNVGTITTTYAIGSVTGATDSTNIGGLVGTHQNGSIATSYATGSVTGGTNSIRLGGLVGLNAAAISDSYASGAVEGAQYVGGLVGRNSVNGSITNSYSFGAVVGNTPGGLVGTDGGGTVTHSYWNTVSSGQSSSAGGDPLSDTQMANSSNYNGWDFTTVWNIDSTTSYPYLRANEQTPHPFFTDGVLTNTWTGTVNTFWLTAANWSLGHIPTGSERVLIPDVAATAFIELGGGAPVAVKGITSDENFRITGSGTALTLNGNTTFNAGLRMGPGTLITANKALTLNGGHTIGAGAQIDLGVMASLSIDSHPYAIVRDLSALQSMGTNGFYALAGNVDASTTTTWNDGAGFVPVGLDNGHFDGLGHTIDRLTINRPLETNVGLFSYTNPQAEIRNIGLTNVDLVGDSYTGSLVGNNSGAINNSYASGNVSGGTSMGGLAGANIGSIGSSYATVNVSGGTDIGGLVGSNGGSIGNSYATGGVSGGGNSRNVGGLIGFNYGPISDSYATGAVSGGANSNDLGGLVGRNADMIGHSYAIGNVSGGTGIGGLAGFNGGSIGNSYAIGAVSGQWTVGGLVGQNENEISNSFATGNVNGGADSYVVGGLVGLNNGTISASYATGAVSGQGEIGGLVGSNYGTTSDSRATGNVNGGAESYEVGGLVGYNLGTISDSYATGTVSGQWDVGGLVGYNDATIANSHYNVDSVVINTAHQVGLGALYDTQYQDWIADKSLNIADYFGSPSGGYYSISGVQGMKDLLGFADNPAHKFKLTGNIDLSATPGLFIPYLAAQEFNGNSFVVSNLTISQPGNSQLGLFGKVGAGSTVMNLGVSNASVTGNYDFGGLTGRNEGTISNTFSTGNVSGGAGSGSIGGLVGSNSGTISDSYATGTVSGESGVGGLVGYNYNNGTVSRSFAASAVSGMSEIGGLVGYNDGTLETSYWNSDAVATGIGGGNATGATALTNASMRQKASFADWDIANTGGESAIWRIYEDHTYPLLSSFLTPLTVTANDANRTFDTGAFAGGNGITYSIASPTLSGSLVYGGSAQGAINAGSYAITPSGYYSNQQGYDISYISGTLTITPASLTAIVGNLTGTTTKVYDGTNTATLTPANYVLTGWVGSDSASVTKTTGTYGSSNVGSALPVTVSLATSDFSPTGATLLSNYSLPVTVSGNIGSITQRPVAVTANAQTKTFGAADPTLTYLVGATAAGSGLVGSDALSGSLSRVAGETVAGGPYAITQGSLSAGTNYAISYSGADLTITPASLTAIVGSLTGTTAKVYDGTNTATLTPANFALTGWVGADSASVTKTIGTYGSINVGSTLPVTVSLASSDFSPTGATLLSNYNLPVTVSGNIGSITQRPVAVTANAQTKTFGAADPTLTYLVGATAAGSGLVGSDALSGSLSRVAGETVAGGPYAITQGSLNAGSNYSMTYNGAGLTINPSSTTTDLSLSSLVRASIVTADRGPMLVLVTSTGFIPLHPIDSLGLLPTGMPEYFGDLTLSDSHTGEPSNRIPLELLNVIPTQRIPTILLRRSTQCSS
jgi:filamentous hemagglutinin family protein